MPPDGWRPRWATTSVGHFRLGLPTARTRKAARHAALPKQKTMAIHDQLDLWGADVTVPTLLTVKEAGRILAISRSSLYELIGCGHVETVHIGRSVRIPADAIASYVRTLRSTGGQ
jgi:excisionase family DNA binding protein